MLKLAIDDRRLIDPGNGIPLDPSEQLPYLRITANGAHLLDPPQDHVSQEPSFPFRPLSTEQLLLQAPQMRLLNLAKSYLGYHEDSRGGTIFGDWYGNQPIVHDRAFYAAPWCDMFLAWLTFKLFGAAGLKAIGDYALTTAHASFLHKHGVTNRPSKLPVGAFAFQNWDLNGVGNSNLPRIDHVEAVETDHGDGTATFVGGNVGNGVRRTRRSKAYLVVIAEWWKLLPAPPVPPKPVVPKPRRQRDDWFGGS